MAMVFRFNTLKVLKKSNNVSDPMPEKKFCWPMIIKCLSEMYFLFRGPAWKYFVVYIISPKCTANVFVWCSGLKTFQEIIGYNNIYLLCKCHSLEWKYFLFHGLAWKHFAVFIIRQSSLTVWLTNMISAKQKLPIFQMEFTPEEKLSYNFCD